MNNRKNKRGSVGLYLCVYVCVCTYVCGCVCVCVCVCQLTKPASRGVGGKQRNMYGSTRSNLRTGGCVSVSEFKSGTVSKCQSVSDFQCVCVCVCVSQ